MRRMALLCTSLLSLGIPCEASAQGAGGQASFRFQEASLRASLDTLAKLYRVSIVYFDRDVDGKSVSAICTGCTVEDALNSVLAGASLRWTRYGNQFVLRGEELRPGRHVATISGTVVDSMTGEWIVDGTVLLEDSMGKSHRTVRRWCPTNAFGFFSLRNVSPGNYTLVVRALGYQNAQISLAISTLDPEKITVGMVQEEITMQEVTVEGRRTALASAERFARGVYLRSVPSDQNQYLIDGARIYNPSHYGGVLSTFNVEALNDVQSLVGGMPPSYGGHVGGIVDLAMREGSGERISGSAGTGSLGSQLSIEGPITDTTTFIASGRRGYPDVGVPFLGEQAMRSRLGSSEVIAKVTHRLSSGGQISLNGYLGRDAYSNQVGDTGERLNNNFSWGNSALNLRWIGIVSPSLFLHASAVYTQYDFSLDHSLFGIFPNPGGFELSSEYTVEDIGFRLQGEQYYDEDHTVRAGVEVIRHRMNAEISPFSTQAASFTLKGYSTWEASVYLQDQWKILPGVTVELGGRATSFSGDRGTFSAVDPRFSLLFSPDEYTRVYGSLTAINEFVHPYRNSGIFLLYPTQFWYPSTRQAPPSTSLQATFGLEKGVRENAYIFSVEPYYRVTNNLHEFRPDTLGSASREMDAEMLLGTGKAYGVELSVRKRTGDLTGSVSYTLAWVRETVPELNNGSPFSPSFDRRHEIQIAARYTPMENWAFGFLCVLASDQGALSSLKGASSSGQPAGVRSRSGEFLDVNGGRLPGFQRIELSVLRAFSLGSFPCQLSLRFLNGYGLLDPVRWKTVNVPDIRYMWTAELDLPKLLPLYPAAGLTVRF